MTTRPSKTSRAPTATDKYVGARIRRYRNASGLTLQQLAETLSIAHQQLQKYETGANRISAGMLHEISQILHVPISLFFPEGEGSTEQDIITANANAHAKLKRIAEILEEPNEQG